jgi:hypothetical protein
VEGWAGAAALGLLERGGPGPLRKRARGETNFGGGSECGQFSVVERCLWSLRGIGTEAGPLSRRRGPSRVSPVYRTGAQRNPDTAVCFCVGDGVESEGGSKQVSLAGSGRASAVTWRAGLPRPNERGFSDGRAQATALAGQAVGPSLRFGSVGRGVLVLSVAVCSPFLREGWRAVGALAVCVSPTQRKLRRCCNGLRKAKPLSKSERAFRELNTFRATRASFYKADAPAAL